MAIEGYRKILIVEDEATIALPLQKQLVRLGFQVTDVLAYGEDLPASIGRSCPDVILMDITLAGNMTGLDAAVTAKEKDIPVIFLTAHCDDETIQKISRSGSMGYLLKPVAPSVLHVTIEMALERSGLERKLRENQDVLAKSLRGSQSRQRELSALLGGTKEILASENLQQTAQALLGKLHDIIEADFGYLMVLDSGGMKDEIIASEFSTIPADKIKSAADRISKTLAEICRANVAKYYNNCPCELSDVMKQTNLELKNIILVPFALNGKVAGAVVLANKVSDFSDSDILLIEAFGELMAISLNNFRNTEKRCQIELALRESNAFQHAILASTDDGIVVYDKNLTCRMWNRSMSDITGILPECVIGKTVFEGPAFLNTKDIINRLQEAIEGKTPAPRDLPYATDGSTSQRYLAIRYSPLRSGDGQISGVVVSIRDITERRLAQDALVESEARLRATFDASPDAIAITRLSDGVFVNVNDSFLKILGYKREDIIGKSSIDVGVWVKMEDRGQMVLAMKENGSVFNFEATFCKKNGDHVTGLFSAAKIQIAGQTHVLSTMHDITERTRMLEEIKLSEKKFSEIFKNSPDMISLSRLSDGILIDINPAFESAIGFSRGECLGQSAIELGICGNVIAHENFIRKLLSEKTVCNMQMEVYKKDKTKIIVLVSATIITVGTEQLILCMMGDITERIALENKMRQMEKMQAIGQLASGVAHDFNNQLAAMMGFAQMITRNTQEDKSRSHAEKIYAAGQNAANLIKQLLAFSRKGGQSLPVNIHELLSETENILARSLDKSIEISHSYDAGLSTVKGDKGRLQNAFLNLAINARDAMPQGGKLTFTTRSVDIDETMPESVSYELSAGKYILITVSDSGCGIAPENISRIFEPFFTTKESGKGTGLGLSAVYGTIKEHLGTISVSSKQGEGTIFEIYLPLAANIAVLPKLHNDQPASINCKCKIILIDDESHVRDVAREFLESMSCCVTVFDSGQQALEYYQAHKDAIDLIVTDIAMPKMNGLGILRQIREISGKAKAILITGHGATMSSEEMSDLGIVDVILKPFDEADFKRRVVAAINR